MSGIRRESVVTPDGLVAGVLCSPELAVRDTPLLICIHGGGCNGRYFDMKGVSLVEKAAGHGVPVLLIDRPGYGASAPPDGGATPIAQGAFAVRALVEVVRKRTDIAQRPLSMIGHSIGGAVALTYAAQSEWPRLTALCVSGIGDRPTAEVRAFHQPNAVGRTVEPPANWFFGPEGSYTWKSAMALRAVAEPWRKDEVDEVLRGWPMRWPAIARTISCPVHFRLAEFERIWETDASTLHRVSNMLARTDVDAAILPEGGHLYEVHRRGAELIESQLAFVMAQARR